MSEDTKEVKFDPNAPAFGNEAQVIEKKEAPETSEEVKEEVKEEIKEETPKEEVPVTPLVEEENKVPYSRFKKFHDEATDLRQTVADLEAKFEAKQEVSNQPEVPSFWVKLYGDSPEAKEAWKIQSEQNQELVKHAKEEALEAVRNERHEETERVGENVEMIDNHFEALGDFVGRKVTDKEQSSILDIVDEYTPKDKDGNYAGQMLPFDKAWEVYEFRNNASKAPKKTSRDSVASLSGTQTQGQPSDKAEQDKNFNPLDWNSWRNKI